jgi:hypothetical protein
MLKYLGFLKFVVLKTLKSWNSGGNENFKILEILQIGFFNLESDLVAFG